jgi:acetylglutamate kinase
VASETAIALVEAKGERQEARGNVQLTFCFEKAGVLRDADDELSLIPCITRESYKQLLADGIVSGGMIPKIDNAYAAIEHGVQSVRITHANNLQGGTIIVEK